MSEKQLGRSEFLNKLSTEQQEFLNVNNNNALVSASAGSGKTFTMTKKLVDLLVYYDVDVEDLLVVTFTNSAGSELKQKLYNALLDEINNLTNVDISKDKLYEKLEKIASCDIGTLHSVCYKYILKFFYKCNIDPDSSILSEADCTYLLEEAINTIVEKYSTDDGFYELFDAYSGNRNNLKVINLIKSLYYFVVSLPNIDDFKNKSLKNINIENINESLCAQFIYEKTKNNLTKYKKQFEKLHAESSNLGLKNYNETIAIILQYINLFENSKNFEENHKNVFGEINIPTVRAPKNADGVTLDFVEEYKSVKASFVKDLKDLKSYYIDEDIESIVIMENCLERKVSKLFDIVYDVIDEYSTLKQQKNGLDYSDLEHNMLKILNDDVVLSELRNKYKFIFVDEYQDINNLQEDILQKLSNGKNLYMIGDVKQSIYGFRLCTPDIFIKKYSNYKEKSSGGKSIELNKNYRSVDNILQFVNYIFKVIGTKETMGVDYFENAMLLSGKEVKNNFEGDISCELNVIDKNQEVDEEQDDNEVNLDKDAETEATLVVNKVKEYLGKEYFNLDTKRLQKINYGDIAILIRDKSPLLYKIYLELLNNNIPVSAEIKLKLFKTFEINLLVSILKLISNMQDDLSLVTVLHSAVVNLSNDDLVKIRLFKNDSTFYDSAHLYADQNDDVISFKLNKFFKEINNFRELLNSVDLKELVVAILTKYNLNNYFYSFVDGNQKLTNIELFMGLLDNQNYSNNLSKFLSYIELLSQKDYTSTVQNGSNFVTITTMHKSKGLDYPVVIACELGKSFSKQSLRQDTIITNELGVGLKHSDVVTRTTYSTLSYMSNRLNKEITEKKEQLRLLYVALTRAKNYMCLIGSYSFKNIEKLKYQDVLSCNSFMELIIYSIIKNGHINKLLKNNEIINIDNELRFVYNKYGQDDINNDVFDNKLEVNENKLFIDNDVVTDLKRSFMYIYPYSKIKNVALKTSVTGLMQNEDYTEINTEPKSLTVGEFVGDNIALKIGNAYHLIMENVDYFADNNIEEIFEKLRSQNLIEKEVESHINIKSIKNAVETVKGLIQPNTKIFKEQQFIIKDQHCNLIDGSSDETKVMVQGVIDLMLVTGGKAIIIDFKTNRTNNIDDLKNKYKLQLKLYKYALSHGKNVDVEETYLYSFFLNKLIKVD